MPALPRGNLLLSAGLALAYYAASRLGAWAAIGPNETSAIWPAAGLALAASMLAGARAVPGLAVAVGVVDRGGRVERFDADASRLAMAIQNHVDLTAREGELRLYDFGAIEAHVRELLGDELPEPVRP